jgi:hypothetical protein
MKTLTVKTPYRVDTWLLSQKLRVTAMPIAKKLGIGLKQLLTKVSNGEFIYRIPAEMEEGSAPPDFQITLPRDKSLQERILRAAAVNETPIQNFAWQALACFIEGVEESYIFAADGSVAGDALDLEPFRFNQYGKQLLNVMTGEIRDLEGPARK